MWTAKVASGIAAGLVGLAALGGPAGACGSLVAPNGSVQLLRTTTLAAYHDGVEHYVTSFQFSGTPTSFGSIVPLPAEPTTVERGGDWTLQRLVREVRPPVQAAGRAEDGVALASASTVEVLQQVRIDSLDIAILRGGGADVFDWANENGFSLPGDTEGVLEGYGARSPYFMAARFDASDATARGFASGDGIPIHLTIPVDRPWVPLHILAAAKPSTEVVRADVFLLTDDRPSLLTGRDISLNLDAPASDLLLSDLRSDKGMAWVPTDAWLTHLALDVPAGRLGYDLAVGVDGERAQAVDTGLDPATVRTTLAQPAVAPPSSTGRSLGGGIPLWLLVGLPLGAVCVLGGAGAVVLANTRSR